MGTQSVECQYFIHIRIGEPEKLIIPYIRDRVYLQIVQSGKDTFLRNPETPGEHRKVQVAVSFQRIAQKIADETYHLIVISGLERLI